MPEKLSEQRLKEIQRYFSEVGVHMHCPSCYQDVWNIPQEQKTQSFFIAAADSDDERPGEVSVYETFVMVCGVCGFVRQHSYAVIESGMETLKEQGGKRIITFKQ